MLVALVAAGYLGWVWVPVYLTHYEAKQLVRQTGNRAVHDRRDAEMLEDLVTRLRGLDDVETVGDDGRAGRRPAIDIQVKDVTWERPTPTSLRVAFEYERDVTYPFLDRRVEQPMTVDLTMDTSLPDWGKK
jgi:hypothetical protein